MKMEYMNYEAQIKHLKKWRNWLLGIIVALFIADVVIYEWKYDVPPSDEEVLEAAIQVNYMGYAYALKLENSEIDKDLVIEMAREDSEVLAQVERNRSK